MEKTAGSCSLFPFPSHPDILTPAPSPADTELLPHTPSHAGDECCPRDATHWPWGATLLSHIPPVNALRAPALGQVFLWFCQAPAENFCPEHHTHDAVPPQHPVPLYQSPQKGSVPDFMPAPWHSSFGPWLQHWRHSPRLREDFLWGVVSIYLLLTLLLLQGTRVCSGAPCGLSTERAPAWPSLPVPHCMGSCSPSASAPAP